MWTSLTLKIYGSDADRENNENIQDTQTLTLQSDYSFEYIFNANTWHTNPNENKLIKVIIQNLSVS